MILICTADCLQPCNVVDYEYSLHGLPMDSDEYFRILYEVSFKPSLFLCHCKFFNNDFCLITKKVQQQNKYSFRFLFSLVGIWASSLYSCLGFKFKLESQINYIVGERKQKYLNFYNVTRLHARDLLWSFSQNFTLNY